MRRAWPALILLTILFAGTGRTATATDIPGSAQAVIAEARLAEPLVRSAPTTLVEDAALAAAVTAYDRRASPDDYGPLTGFIARYPRSGWAPAVETNLGLSYLHDGYFSRAMGAWRHAWSLGKSATDPHAKAVVDRAFGELVLLSASLGQFANVTELFNELGKRPIAGSATEDVQTAREELALVTKDPRHLFNCGPVALRRLIIALNSDDQRGESLPLYRAGPAGTNLAELGGLAAKAKFPYRIVMRAPGGAVPVPALIHWKLGHYSAIVGRANGRYHIEDSMFPGSGLWVTQAALDAEASGYLLIAANSPAGASWRTVGVKEAAKVWGKGPTSRVLVGDAGDPVACPCSAQAGPTPMTVYSIKEATVGVTLSDTPVGYSPPIGPSARIEISYNQREDSQPANFSSSNVGPKWTLNWLSYVTDDPANPGASVSRYLAGGGAFYYGGCNSGTGQFSADFTDGSILVLTSTSPITYRRQLANGAVEIYAQSNGASSYPRKIFLSQVIDPKGNILTLNYDPQMRLISLTDATGRLTTFSYGLVSQPLLITKVTDPFGRAATLTYDASGRLSAVTDILGLTSSFAYDAYSLVNSMTTPYGTTSFAYTTQDSNPPYRFVQVTDPLGYHEREEWIEPAPGHRG